MAASEGDGRQYFREPDFLSGGGELGRLIRAYPWGSTPLGPPETWPQNLRMALRIMLTSRQPIWIGWGTELIYFYNDPYKAIIGGKHPHALGRAAAEVWREIWDDIGPMLQTALGGDQGTYVEAQLLIMERNGYPEETYYTFSYSPIPNDDGTIGGIICANSDDTQRVIGERQLALLRHLAADTTDARTWQVACERSANALQTNLSDLPFALIYMANADNTRATLAGVSGIGDPHRAAPVMLSADEAGFWPVGEVLRSQTPRLVHDLSARFGPDLPTGRWDTPPTAAAMLPILPAGETGRAGVLVVGLNPFRLFDENYMGFLRLITGQIAAAIASAQAYEEERHRAEALAAIDHAKTTFFSNVSHEFRTPLTLMLGPLEDALNDTDAPALSSVQRSRLRTAHRNSLRLLKLVNSLLDFSRIEAGRAEAIFQPTDLATFTTELASNFESATAKAGLELRIACHPLPRPVYVDHGFWEKIVLNLLSNAFKFTFEGHISVHLAPATDGRTVELTISDTGVGIPAHELPLLFERFHRVSGQLSRSFEGSGIGLALVQELVKLQAGTIRVESAVGVGTNFIVSLPLAPVHVRPEPEPFAAQAIPTSRRAEAFLEEAMSWLSDDDESSTKLESERSASDAEFLSGALTGDARILVADDNVDMRNYITRILGRRWKVQTVANGQAALESIRRDRPDLVLTDVMMPLLDGFGLLRALRNDPDLRDLPVIVLSARAGEEARVDGLDAGAHDYLTKPFSARELVARISANLEMARVRREATHDLRESEARFRNMADHTPMMMWMTDSDGSVTYLNRAWYEFTGQTAEQALGAGAWDAVHSDDRHQSEKAFFSANAAGEPFRFENRLRRADGIYRWTLSAAAPRFGHNAEFLGYIGSVIDITERKDAEEFLRQSNAILEQRVATATAERVEAEARLLQAQKMEAVGRLTGGVAHDFNNVLQIISGSLQLLTRDLAGNSRAEQRVQTAIAAIVRGSKLATQLLAFGRRTPLAPKVVNLGRLIRGVDDMLRRALGEGIQIETVIAGGLWNTFVDTVQVENALLNLAINARDAMEGNGRLTIEAGNAFLDDVYAASHAEVTAGQYVLLAVTDTGCGIPPDLVERVFEPFFTTKPEGLGTGLGLSMVYGFVKQSGGHVKIYTEAGFGTTVRLYLPRAYAREDVEAEIDAGPAVGGSETILVVEDDDDVRATVVELLTELGYRVLKAKDSQSALAIIESGMPIDLLFTDVVMPGVPPSTELARKAQERQPNMAVLFTSGYTDNAIVHGGRLDPGVELLSKPYSREALARKLRHVLRNQQQRGTVRPSSGASRTTPLAEIAPAVRAGMQTLRVLFAEDDEIIRLLTAEMLTALGYEVTEVADGAEASGKLQTSEYDILLTDLALPGVSGRELAALALSQHPLMRIIIASGNDVPAGDDVLAKSGRVVMLSKPYDEKRLEIALNAAMALQSGRQ
jgi:PAS domain S-box-containing protein